MNYPGWVSMPCNLWRQTRTASCEAGRSLALVAIIAVIAITMTTYKGDLSLKVGLDKLIFTAPSSPWSPGFLTQKALKCDASFLVAILSSHLPCPSLLSLQSFHLTNSKYFPNT